MIKKDKKIELTPKGTKISFNDKIPDKNSLNQQVLKKQPSIHTIVEQDMVGKFQPALTSPSNFKRTAQTNNQETLVKNNKKIVKQPINIQTNKIENGRNSNFQTFQGGPPKFQNQKDKMLFTYNSQKNLHMNVGNNKINEGKVDYENKNSKLTKSREALLNQIQYLEKSLNEANFRINQNVQNQKQLVRVLEQLKVQYEKIMNENVDLKRKFDKMKIINDQNKKLLKSRINNFNEEGQEVIQYQQKIKLLQEKVQAIIQQNQLLKLERMKNDQQFQQQSQAPSSMRNSVINAKSTQKLNRIFFKSTVSGTEVPIVQFNETQGMFDDLQLESIIDQQQEEKLNLKQIKQNHQNFADIKAEFQKQIVKMQQKYQSLTKDYELLIAEKQNQIFDLQIKNDNLFEQKQTILKNLPEKKIKQTMDEILIQSYKQTSQLQLKIYDLNTKNKDINEDNQKLKVTVKYLESLLDIEKMKRNFKNQTQYFQNNVAKFNLCNVIQKLKLKIENDKVKYHHLRQSISPINIEKKPDLE